MAIKIISEYPSEAPGGGDNVFEYAGLSTDTKPTVGVGDNSTYEELDTKKFCIYSTVNTNPITSNGWWEL